MSNLFEYKDLLNESLHSRVFFNDPKLLDSNVYVDPEFGGTLHQAFILRNWAELKKKIPEDELWTRLKAYEHRQAKIIFDPIGHLIADANSQELYKKYYYNSLWADSENKIGIGIIFLITVLLALFYYIIRVWRSQKKSKSPPIVLKETNQNVINLVI
ncbi:FeoB-associated Cys-rich membrane protein [Drosophila suzukii associated hytrosavirus 1]|nr:FeoB-associated Cys-rich membrane protein [Drosophila suzukii associated hytrosavirus 1]